MAFIKKEWKDRLAEFAGRRRLTNIDTGEEMTVDVERDEGLVSQVGDSFSGKNMNDLEGRIEAAFTAFINFFLINSSGIHPVCHNTSGRIHELISQICLFNFLASDS